MMMKNKTGYLLFAALGLALVSLPSHAWQAARGAYGGAAVRGPNGAAVRGPNGNTAVRSYNGGGAYHAPVHYGYRGGTYYNNGYSSGQVAGAAVAGAVVGAAIANRNQPPPPPPTTIIIQQPRY